MTKRRLLGIVLAVGLTAGVFATNSAPAAASQASKVAAASGPAAASQASKLATASGYTLCGSDFDQKLITDSDHSGSIEIYEFVTLWDVNGSQCTGGDSYKYSGEIYTRYDNAGAYQLHPSLRVWQNGNYLGFWSWSCNNSSDCVVWSGQFCCLSTTNSADDYYAYWYDGNWSYNGNLYVSYTH
jgi:hypothetical protein